MATPEESANRVYTVQGVRDCETCLVKDKGAAKDAEPRLINKSDFDKDKHVRVKATLAGEEKKEDK